MSNCKMGIILKKKKAHVFKNFPKTPLSLEEVGYSIDNNTFNALSAGDVEYSDCTSAERVRPLTSVLLSSDSVTAVLEFRECGVSLQYH